MIQASKYVLFNVLLIILFQRKSQQNKLDGMIYQYNGHLINTSCSVIDFNLPLLKYLSVTYSITLKNSSCCPLLEFGLQGQQDMFHLFNGLCFHKSTGDTALTSNFYIIMSEDFTGCEPAGEYIVCAGATELYAAFPFSWNAGIGYVCGKEGILDMTFNFTFKQFLPVCEELQHSFCEEMFGYNQTIFPNLFGEISQKKAVISNFVALGKRYVQLFMEKGLDLCYQPLAKFGCYPYLPRCVNGSHYIPCRQMCLEATQGCAKELKTYGQSIFCGFYPPSLDPNICWYEPVTCEKPQRPEFGSVVTNGTYLFNTSQYFCNSGYELQGNSVRYCMYSGKWNGSIPRCLLPVKIATTAIISCSVIIVLIICVIMSCICFKKVQKLRKVGSQREKTLFLTYSSHDNDSVEKLLPEMKNNLHGWNIVTYQQDFPAGQNLLNCINEGVWKSDAVLVYLTSNYVSSDWCGFEFTEAKTRSAIEPGFKCIAVLQEDRERDFLDTLPGSFKQYVKSHVYLTSSERLFWKKLRRALN